jgi:hypothetical protein
VFHRDGQPGAATRVLHFDSSEGWNLLFPKKPCHSSESWNLIFCCCLYGCACASRYPLVGVLTVPGTIISLIAPSTGEVVGDNTNPQGKYSLIKLKVAIIPLFFRIFTINLLSKNIFFYICTS